MQKIFKAVVRDISHNKSRSFLTFFSLFVVISFPIAMLSTGPSLDFSITENYRIFHLAHVDIRFPYINRQIMGHLNSTIENYLGYTPDRMNIGITGNLKVNHNSNWFTVTASDFNNSIADEHRVNQYTLIDGSDEIHSGEILILKSFADHLGITVNDNISVHHHGNPENYTIAGTFKGIDTLSYDLSQQGAFLMYPEDLREIMEIPQGFYTSVKIYFSDNITTDSIHACSERIQEMLIENSIPFVLLLNLRESGLNASLIDTLSLTSDYLIRGAILIILIVGIVVYIITKRYAVEQRKQTGMLYSFGFSSKSIMLAFLLRTFLLCLIAILMGLFASKYFLQRFSVLLANKWGIIEVFPEFSMSETFEIIGITMAISLGFTFIGAHENISLTPYEAIRGKAKEFKMKTDGMLARILQKFPTQAKIAMRNIFRNSGRSGFTVIAFSFSILLSFSLISVRNDVVLTQEEYYKNLVWDVKAGFNPSANISDIYSELSNSEYIDEVEPCLEAYVQPFNMVNRIAYLRGIEPNSKFFYVDLQMGKSFSNASADECLMSNYLAERLNYSIGDTFDFLLYSVEISLNITGLIRDMESPISIFVQLGTLEKFMGYSPINGLVATAKDDHIIDLEDQLNIDGRVAYAVKMEQFKARMSSIISTETLIVEVLATLGFAISFLSIFSTASIILLERKREYSLERIFGFSIGEIFTQIFIEIGILGGISLIFGLIGGTYYKDFLRKLVSDAFFTIDAFFQLDLYFIQIIFGILTIIFSIIPQTNTLKQKKLASHIIEE